MKRKTTSNDEAAAASVAPLTNKKKRSPLLGKPQNFYAPDALAAPSNMTREELSAWRKEERRKRNRASAAASRHKTQSKIAELEGQVSLWKARYEDIQEQMLQLQRQVDMLTRAQSPQMQEQQHRRQQHYLVSPPTSHPNSPSTSTSLEGRHPSNVTSSADSKNFLHLPPLMLSPPSSMDHASPVENKTDITPPSHVDESKKHLMISRQA